MNYAANEVLEKFGFVNKGDHFAFDRPISLAEGGIEDEETNVSVVVTINENGIYTGYVRGTRDNNPYGIPSHGLSYESQDISDMIALAHNELAYGTHQVTGFPLEEGFDDPAGGFWITQPFMGGEYFDYALKPDVDPNDAIYRLEDPQTIYEGYNAWKAEFIAKLMDSVEPKM